ncbi:hypothetical protein [Herminiimonas aquatilis]|uniref:DUF2029 domain-containing protein n=1 Tax=Herminiimonas aquatilis TaxID=345342 RepID=A0ABW2JB39_9BURK
MLPNFGHEAKANNHTRKMRIFQVSPNKAWLGSIDLNDSKTFSIVCFIAPVIFGLISIWLGADTNWDLKNYHIYNAFAFLNGKLNIDLAPAGMQTYFNPVLDVPYYLMSRYLPAPLVGFIMGVVHGINFVLLAGIARNVLSNLPAEDRVRIPLLLSILGCLTANFLSGIGNSMGDDTTAVFVLASLLIVLNGWAKFSQGGLRAILVVIVAGLFAGFSAGLKLTNVVYAIALCASFCIAPLSWGNRIRLAFFFGIGVLIGTASTAGYWFYEMWRSFGNPLFPQFSAFFPNPLTPSIGVADVIWRPKNWLETALWPFIFSLNPQRVGQLSLHQIIWPVVYVLFWCWVATVLIRKRTQNPTGSMQPSAKYVVAFVALGYLLWMQLFSIQRYLVPIEVCAPLVVFILLTQIMDYKNARKIAFRILAVTTAVVLLGGLSTWGHASWAEKMFSIELPNLEDPLRTTAIIVGGDPAYGWVAAQFPANVAFTQVQGSFPEAMPAYGNRIRQMVKQRGGPVFALLPAQNHSRRLNKIARIRKVAFNLGISSTDSGCAALQWAATKFKFHAVVTMLDVPTDRNKCSIDVSPSDMVALDVKNEAFLSLAKNQLEKYGYSIDFGSCKTYRTYIGRDESEPFQWCRVFGL